jgi:hypothetical protein
LGALSILRAFQAPGIIDFLPFIESFPGNAEMPARFGRYFGSGDTIIIEPLEP